MTVASQLKMFLEQEILKGIAEHARGLVVTEFEPVVDGYRVVFETQAFHDARHAKMHKPGRFLQYLRGLSQYGIEMKTHSGVFPQIFAVTFVVAEPQDYPMDEEPEENNTTNAVV